MLKKFSLAAAMLALVVSNSFGGIVINEIYVGGGSSNATAAFTRDYVEIYNNGASTVDLSNWRISYASAAGNYGTNNVVSFGVGSFIGANDYLLLVTGGAGTGGAPIVGANYYNGTTTGASLSATVGSVSIFDAANAQVDVVGYGAVSSPDGNGIIKLEGTAASTVGLTIAGSLSRTGFVDSNNNLADFSVLATPTPTAGTNSLVIAVPEPASITLVSLACLTGFVAYSRRRIAKKKSVEI